MEPVIGYEFATWSSAAERGSVPSQSEAVVEHVGESHGVGAPGGCARVVHLSLAGREGVPALPAQ